jgi:hypothetical protein
MQIEKKIDPTMQLESKIRRKVAMARRQLLRVEAPLRSC